MSTYQEQKIKNVTRWPKHAGKADLLKHLRGERLTQREAIRAYCYECGGGEGGTCTIPLCPLLPFSPYAETGDRIEPENGNESSGS